MTESRSGEQQSKEFEGLLMLHLDASYGIAFHLTRNRDEAEDLIQESAIRAFRAFHSFEQGTNFKAWFSKILLNCFRNQHRSRKREPASAALEDVPELYLYKQAQGFEAYGSDTNPAAIVISKMSEDQIRSAIGLLPQEYRVVCVLYFMEEFAYQEIADILDCPVGTVRSRLHRGRKILQKALWEVAHACDLLPDAPAGGTASI